MKGKQTQMALQFVCCNTIRKWTWVEFYYISDVWWLVPSISWTVREARIEVELKLEKLLDYKEEDEKREKMTPTKLNSHIILEKQSKRQRSDKEELTLITNIWTSNKTERTHSFILIVVKNVQLDKHPATLLLPLLFLPQSLF